MTAMVEIEGLSKRFGVIRAVEDVSFGVERGEVLGFLGPNGAGKSTTMKMITGFLAADAGKVRVAGRDLDEDPIGVKRHLGYLPEGAPLYADMTTAAFLEFVAAMRDLRGKRRRRRVQETVARVHLGAVLHQPIETLSKGFKRRVGLAQAIVHDPQVLVLDEPTDGLDPNQKHEVRTLIREMAREKAIILSTHILEEVDAVCTRAIIIAAGRVVADGTPAELAARSPLHGSIVVAVHGTSAGAAREVFTQVPGIAALEVLADLNGVVRCRLFPHAGPAPVAEVGEAARRNGWSLEELHVTHGRLDDVFRTVTTTGVAGPITAAPPGI